ncbi:MAG: hypothetical protein FGM63_01460 [Candidatus Nanopelagicaceae bacterium]|nr:hypothetical protein [Candidatus Nanopelagicaceae bacterium]
MVFLYLLALLLISVTDIKFRVIPKGLNLALLATTSSFLMLSGKVAVVLASLFAFLLYAGLYRLTKGGVGYGDVRLAAVAIDFQTLAPIGSLSIHCMAWVIAGLVLLVKKSPSRSLPFAPFLLSATIIVNHL